MNSSKFPASCVLFDLDGTLLDTAADIANALNATLQYENKNAISYNEIRNAISLGTTALIMLAFGNKQSKKDLLRRQNFFLNYYEKNICTDTTIFTGMENVLDELEQQGVKWGVVTNKAAFLTDALLDELNLSERACSVISGDTLKYRKPSPEQLYFAATQCNVLATECIYVGDAQRDIESGNRAGMLSLLASYGYIARDDQPETWQANGIIQSPEEILDWLDYATDFAHSNHDELLCH